MDRPVITSRQNPLIKFVCGLAEKKIRNKEGLFRFDGIKLLAEALDSRIELKYIVYRHLASESVSALVENALSSGRIAPDGAVAVSDEVFDKISEERSPEGVVTVARMAEEIHLRADARGAEQICGDGDRVLIAESLRDPGNLGTVIRSCFALGIDTLILTDDCADLYNGKTVRAAMGGIFRMRTVSLPASQLPELITMLRNKGRRVYAAALSDSAVSIGDIELKAGDCFVIGNEGHGLSESVVLSCTRSVIIPMREDAESLNAAAAAAICIWETVKVR